MERYLLGRMAHVDQGDAVLEVPPVHIRGGASGAAISGVWFGVASTIRLSAAGEIALERMPKWPMSIAIERGGGWCEDVHDYPRSTTPTSAR